MEQSPSGEPEWPTYPLGASMPTSEPQCGRSRSIGCSDTRSDTELAEAAANALRWNASLSGTEITPVVKDGWSCPGRPDAARLVR